MATAFAEANVTGLKSRSFTVAPQPLTAIENVAYEALKQIANEGRRATQPELCAATGVGYQTGALPAILKRLEEKGHITRQVFQRGMTVCIVETGQCTAAPECTVPHWRSITDRPPTPAIHQVRQHDMSIARWIETEARTKGRNMADFLVELVLRGAQDYRADQEI